MIDVIILISIITLTRFVNMNFSSFNFFWSTLLIGVGMFCLSYIEITLSIILIYFSVFSVIYLINGFLFNYSFFYFSLMQWFYLRNFIYYQRNSLLVVVAFITLPSFSFSVSLFLCFPVIWSLFLEIGFNFSNVVSDNDSLMLTIFLFFLVSFNVKNLRYLLFIACLIFLVVI